MREKRRHPGALAMLLGVVLMLLGALALWDAGDTLQYVFPAPESSALTGSSVVDALER